MEESPRRRRIQNLAKKSIQFAPSSKKVIRHILNLITVYEVDIVWRHIMDDEYENPIDEKGFDVVMSAINNALDESNRYSIKRQILAIIARFSGIGIHQIKAARKHAFDKGNMNKTTVMNKL
ncbi:unnamed protein product [Rotaria magnacalcarata]|uniref:Uncharacterized protein n=1 Tax=Rotaria magnacalcarata TaxID=392030 RepID=A0A816VUQ3_9BILA|nr:unnamed protein product [Rotaria magnacalcarata]